MSDTSVSTATTNSTNIVFGMRKYSAETAATFPSLPPEVEEGNVEYKLKLLNPTNYRLEHLITQMKWRLKEGFGEAIYEIGVEDNGLMTGLLQDELDSSLSTLREMADRLGAETVIIREREINCPEKTHRFAVEVLVRQIPESQEFIDIRVGCLGNVDVGKSTLLGVLCYGHLDNGRGRARLNVFRHLHEIQTGRTSSISHEILGFDSTGQVLNYSDSTPEEICLSASKLITFLDLAGHQKYIKTTIFGLTGHAPEMVMLVVAANRGIAGTTKEHLGLAVALKIPFVVVVNKIDICDAVTISKTVTQLERILKSTGLKKLPIVIEDDDDVLSAAGNFASKQVTPIFKVSSVTGENLELLRSFFNTLPSIKTKIELDELIQQPMEFQIDELFSIQKVGTVLSGTLRCGTVREGDHVMIGPSECGEFAKARVASIHRNRTPCRFIQAGQTACIALDDFNEKTNLRRGQMLLEASMGTPLSSIEFDAEIFLLFHTTKISRKFQASLHIGNIVQTAAIKHLDKDGLCTGQRANVRFKFISHPEYIHEGDRLLLREGRTKAVGEITRVYPYDSNRRVSSSDSE